MECRETLRLLDAGIDGELDLATQLAWEAHLAGCPSCRSAHAGRVALVRRVRAGTDAFAMPDALRVRLLAALPGGTRAPPPAGPVHRGWWRGWWREGWLGAGSLSLASAALGAALTFAILSPEQGDGMAQDLVAAHVRSLMAEHLTDVASSDRHTVKPWFNGRVDVAPPVPDLAEQGFPLAGGRLDYVGGRPVAALVYRRNRHVINLFAWADAASAADPPRLEDRQGYTLLHWTQPGLAVWAVSDLNRGELEDFRRLWSQAATP